MKRFLAVFTCVALIVTCGMGAFAAPKYGPNVTDSVYGVQNQKEINAQKKEMMEEWKRVRDQLKLERKALLHNMLVGQMDEEEVEEFKNEYKVARGVFKIKSNPVNFDVPPVIKAGRTLIPVRAITEGMGAEVLWEPATDTSPATVTITRDGKEIVINLETQEITVDGDPVEIDIPGLMISNRVFVPLRFISETLGDKVSYNSITGDVDIYDSEEIEELLEELTVEELIELAEELEIDSTDIDAAETKAELIELILAQDLEEVFMAYQELFMEMEELLEGLTLAELIELAEELEIDSTDIDAAETKAELIELILAEDEEEVLSAYQALFD